MADDARVQKAIAGLQAVLADLQTALPATDPSLPAGAVKFTGTVTAMQSTSPFGGGSYHVTFVGTDGVTRKLLVFPTVAVKFSMGTVYTVIYVPSDGTGFDQIYNIQPAPQPIV